MSFYFPYQDLTLLSQRVQSRFGVRRIHAGDELLFFKLPKRSANMRKMLFYFLRKLRRRAHVFGKEGEYPKSCLARYDKI